MEGSSRSRTTGAASDILFWCNVITLLLPRLPYPRSQETAHCSTLKTVIIGEVGGRDGVQGLDLTCIRPFGCSNARGRALEKYPQTGHHRRKVVSCYKSASLSVGVSQEVSSSGTSLAGLPVKHSVQSCVSVMSVLESNQGRGGLATRVTAAQYGHVSMGLPVTSALKTISVSLMHGSRVIIAARGGDETCLLLELERLEDGFASAVCGMRVVRSQHHRSTTPR